MQEKINLFFNFKTLKIPKILILLISFLIITNTTFANELYETQIDWYQITTIKIVKWSWYKVIVWVSDKWESLKSLTEKYSWVSAVNWAYFHPSDYGWENDSSAPRISNWTLHSKWDETWIVNVIFAFDKNNNPFLFQDGHDYSSWRGDIYMTGRTINLDKKSDIYNGIWNFPLLLKDWENMLDKALEISEKMKAKSIKNFICSTSDWNTIYMWNIKNPNIWSVPEILKKMWCYNAINLDAGGSSAMIYNNKYIIWPGRNIMDSFIVVKDEQKNIVKINILSKYSTKIDNSFKKIETKISSFSKENQLEFLNNLSIKILKLQDNKNLIEKNKTILDYLKKLVDNKIKSINT